MAIQSRTYDSQRGSASRRTVLTECPACGADLSAVGTKKCDHIAEHDPEDFGL